MHASIESLCTVEDVRKPPVTCHSLFYGGDFDVILTLCIWSRCFMLYFIVSYLYVRCRGPITLVGKRELTLISFTCYVVSFRRGSSFLLLLRMGCVISSPEPLGSQGELIVYPWSGVRRPSVVRPSVRPSSTMLKHLLLGNRLADQSQILCEASLGRGNQSLYKWSRSHDQDGRHAHIW